MRLEEDIKLDYSDVLFRPKRSTLQSRKDVNLKRTYRFKYSKNEWSGIPIMAANMDGVGELEIAEELSQFGMITCLTKQHDVKKIKKNKNIKKIYPHIALSIGIKKEDFEKVHVESSGEEDDDIDEFSVDTSPEAVAKRAAAEGVGMVAGIVACAEQELSQSERLDLYYKFITQTNPTTASIITEAKRLNCGNKAVLVLLEALCIENTEFYTSPCLVINKHVDLLGHFLEDNHKAQFNFIDRLEKLCLTKQELVPKFLRILVNLYDKELIEEEVILKWNTPTQNTAGFIIVFYKNGEGPYVINLPNVTGEYRPSPTKNSFEYEFRCYGYGRSSIFRGSIKIRKRFKKSFWTI